MAGWPSHNGACGGMHVQALTSKVRGRAGVYYQRAVSGDSVSVMFLAGADACTPCATFQHLRWHPSPSEPYRYEGAVCLPAPDAALLAQSSVVGMTVASEFDLRGCFGVDFIRHDVGTLYLVDINPRPPATLDLVADRGRIFAAHMTACAHGSYVYRRPLTRLARAHLILYAERLWRVPPRFSWPAWVADRPPADSVVMAGAPLCTLLAAAADTAAARRKLGERYAQLRAQIGLAGRSPLPDTIGVRQRSYP